MIQFPYGTARVPYGEMPHWERHDRMKRRVKWEAEAAHEQGDDYNSCPYPPRSQHHRIWCAAYMSCVHIENAHRKYAEQRELEDAQQWMLEQYRQRKR